eukprot:Phypoly_transcript_01579.p1 GENE.Phypoly_transcript_01579~~Phypoly_transcript_01579.p1  ORF type:complete len:1064 (+),score=124.40 Phypoly_transcript_01579:78-3269(+)
MMPETAPLLNSSPYGGAAQGGYSVSLEENGVGDVASYKVPGYLSYGAVHYSYSLNDNTNTSISYSNWNGKDPLNNSPRFIPPCADGPKPAIRNWNLEFQKTWEMPKGDAQQQLERAVAQRNLANDFASVAGVVAKIIISEKHLPNCKKSIPPAAHIGGMAGGEKYIAQGIIFKFAIETGNNLYTCDEYAMKAANAELRALMSFMSCNISGLFFPLMALIDYLGYRVIATSLLPISQSTIVYGTSNAAATIHDGSTAPVFMQNIRKAAKCLNLKPHTVKDVQVYTAVDMEGHMGADGRYYIVDTARTFPPSTPTQGLRGAQHLWNFLRPEFVQSYDKPLSSDAYSAFGKHNQQIHNGEVAEATEHLLSKVIPALASELDRSYMCEKDPDITITQLVTVVRRKGINIRYIGVLRNYVTTPTLRTYILVIMVSHVLKNILRRQLRNYLCTLGPFDVVPTNILTTPLADHILQIYSRVIGSGKDADLMWQREVKVGLLDKFGTGLTDDESKPNYDLRAELWGTYLVILFEDLQHSTGIRCSQDLNVRLKRAERIKRVEIAYLLEPGVRVKYMNFLFHDEGESLVRLARTKIASGEADRLLYQAIPTLAKAISIKPNDLHSNAVLGEALILQALATNGPIARSLFLASERKFKECLDLQPDYPLANYGLALAAVRRATHEMGGLNSHRRHMFLKAVKYFARYSSLVPNDVECYYEWGLCLIEKAIFYSHSNFIEDDTKQRKHIRKTDSPIHSPILFSSDAQLTKSGNIEPVNFSDGISFSDGDTNSRPIPIPPPLPPKEFWIRKPRTDVLTSILTILDEAIHKLHKALSLKPDHAYAALHMAKAYYLKAIYLSELSSKSPELDKHTYTDDIDIFYTIAEEQFSTLLSQQSEVDHHEIYDIWGSLILGKSNSRETLEDAQEKYLLSLHAKGLRAPLALASNFDIVVEIGNLYGLEPDNFETPHRWTVFVRMPDGNYCVPFIKQVTFLLHPTFRPSVLNFKREPFSLIRRGWGIFKVQARIRFVDCLGIPSPITIKHKLQLGGVGGYSTLYRIYKQGPQVIVEKLCTVSS